MMKFYLKSSISFFLILYSTLSFSQNIISGKVTENNPSKAVAGASVILNGTKSGTATTADGSFTLTSSQEFPWVLVISAVGYDTQNITVTNANSNLMIRLEEANQFLNEVVVSASRKAEKAQDAPASVSVLSAKVLSTASVAIDPVRELVNVPGVQVQQQSAARLNIEMRGSAALFDTQVFPILDYRSLVGPGIGTFQSDGSGLNSLDLQRIEIVRGPASALYGPGVVSGVVHFMSKSPIDAPGTSIELIGGTMNTYGASVRHAIRSKDKKFGFKVNAHFKKGDEFTLDGSEGTRNAAGVFTSQLSKFKKQVQDPIISEQGIVTANQATAPILLTQKDLDPDGDGNMMQNFWQNASMNGTLEFRPKNDTKIVLAGGTNRYSSVFYNSQGEGLGQATEYWTQARFQKRGLFAQVFYVNNDGGSASKPSFLYQTGLNTSVKRQQLEGQIQYNFITPKFLNADFTVGADYRNAITETGRKVYGRNENDDAYLVIGAYAQGKFELSKKLDAVLATRFDRFNFVDASALSPRIALVYKATPNHTFRASYNIAKATPSGLNIFIDFPVAVVVPGLFDVWLHGQNKAHQFGDKPMIDFTAPGLPDLPYGTPGLPLAVAYGALTPQILSSLQTALPANIFPLVQAILTNPTNVPQGTTGKFTGYNLFTGQPLAPINTKTAQIRTEKSIEIGYKGTFNKKLTVTADWYHINTAGFQNFTAISPTIRFSDQNLAADLSGATRNTVTTQLAAALQAGGMPADQATATANQIGAAVGSAYSQGSTALINQLTPLFGIFGTVESDLAPKDGLAHNMAGYRIFGQAKYWGADVGLNYAINNDLSVFGNYSMVSKNIWNATELGEAPNSGLIYTLNIPKSKYRVGLLYAPASGWRANVAFQHDDSFFANFGQYSGDTDVKNFVDAGVGYKLRNGLSLDITCTNLFNQQYRTFVNMPIIGRRAIAKLTYSFSGKNR
jgi:outer membrane receptor for ferrienterochelin and colicins